MVKHMIIWKMKSDLENKEESAKKIKTELEALCGKIDGLLKMEIIIEKLDSSSGDIMMDSEFTDNDALKAYQVHPLHQAVANNIVRPCVDVRLAFDYEV